MKKTMTVIKEMKIKLNDKQLKVVKMLDKIPNGQNATVVYESDCTKHLKAAHSHSGFIVTKISTIPIQKGIDYSNKRSVKEKRAHQLEQTGSIVTREAFYNKLDNNVAKHKSQEKYYALFGMNTNKKASADVVYKLNGEDISKDDLKNMGILRESFWNKSEDRPEIMTLDLNNIIAVFQ